MGSGNLTEISRIPTQHFAKQVVLEGFQPGFLRFCGSTSYSSMQVYKNNINKAKKKKGIKNREPIGCWGCCKDSKTVFAFLSINSIVVTSRFMLKKPYFSGEAKN